MFKTNVVKHFRWSGMRGKRRIHQSPHEGHVEACSPWLQAEFSLLRPRGVVVQGGTAGRLVFGPSFKVGQARGRAVPWPEGTLAVAHPPDWVLPTTHPSAVQRARGERRTSYDALVADLRTAASLL